MRPCAFLLLRATTLLAVVIAMAAGPASAQSPIASPGRDIAARVTLDEAVALVLAQDPRFAGLPSGDDQRVEASATFSFLPYFVSHYTVLPTVGGMVGTPEAIIDFDRVAPSWVMEVLLSDGCVAPVDGTRFPLPDPCAWRHTWLYRVTPDGQVALLFDEGDPDR